MSERTPAERYLEEWGHEPLRTPAPRYAVPDEDLALYWLVRKRCGELDIGPPWFMEQLKAAERAACDWLEEHGEPEDEYEADDWVDDDDWRARRW